MVLCMCSVLIVASLKPILGVMVLLCTVQEMTIPGRLSCWLGEALVAFVWCFGYGPWVRPLVCVLILRWVKLPSVAGGLSAWRMHCGSVVQKQAGRGTSANGWLRGGLFFVFCS